MIDFYTIPPNSQMGMMHLGKRYFCLAQHYYNNEEYRNFFKQQRDVGHWVTLDNGAGDHALITEDILVWCMKDLMPNEVIPPDVLFDKQTTITNLESFIDRMVKEDLIDKIEIFFCPQGKDKQEWLECYEYGICRSVVKTIGMSKLAIPHAWNGDASNDQGIMEARHAAVDHLLEVGLIQKPLHFLGMGSPLEMQKYKELNNPLFRSTDSCNSIWSAMNEFDWTKAQFQRIRTPHDYFEREMTEEQIILAKSNIEWFENLLS